MTIGLLPEMDTEKILYVGNGSLMGCKMSSLSNHIRMDVADVIKRIFGRDARITSLSASNSR